MHLLYPYSKWNQEQKEPERRSFVAPKVLSFERETKKIRKQISNLFAHLASVIDDDKQKAKSLQNYKPTAPGRFLYAEITKSNAG